VTNDRKDQVVTHYPPKEELDLISAASSGKDEQPYVFGAGRLEDAVEGDPQVLREIYLRRRNKLEGGGDE
jgi:hypothetical protein